ncbi:MAG TPA: hypothetical protein VJN93_03920 [Candidatus Acidoferrum sp.]|nr:hypothetical protein [Candidatus Acidoferrum sp.]
MSLTEEFSTIQLILNSQAETRGVDAFALALIKSEKQMRRLVTHLVYQSSAFGVADKSALRQALGSNNRVYFQGLEDGFDALYPQSVGQLVGSEYHRLSKQLHIATTYRNKIFHGQLTADSLTRSQLRGFVDDIRRWCEILSNSCRAEIGYEGFSNSFRKSKLDGLDAKLQIKLSSVKDYSDFIRNYMQR